MSSVYLATSQATSMEPLSKRAVGRGWRFRALVIGVLAIIGVLNVYVEFLEDVGAWQKGSFDDLKENLARSLVAINQARECSAAEFLRSSLAVEQLKNKEDNQKFRDEILATVRTALKPSGTNPQPPGGGGKVNFNKISEGTPAEEQDKNRCLTDAMRCIFEVSAIGNDPVRVQYARNRMRGYSDSFAKYEINPQTGELEHTLERSLADGGIETITRTGTDSLSGGPSYGFTLKPEYVNTLFKIARESSVFETDCRRIAVTNGNEAIWPILDQYKAPSVLNGIPQSAIFGGVTLSYLGETTARISSDAATRENRFKVVDLTFMTDFSRDYIVDNYIAMDSEVTSLFGQAVGWIRDWTYIRGDGAAKPQGYFNANATIIGGPSTNARYNANQISADDLAWMLSRLASMCWMRSRWIANVTSFPQLYILRDHSGTPVFQPNAMIDQAMLLSLMKGSTFDEAQLVSRPMGMLMGRPLYFSEKVPVLGSTGDISLVCPYEYGDATRSGLELMMSEHFYFNTDRIAYRGKMRHYGRSLWPAAYTQADNIATPASGTQVSPFVLLHS